jgi:hypothetical protein
VFKTNAWGKILPLAENKHKDRPRMPTNVLPSTFCAAYIAAYNSTFGTQGAPAKGTKKTKR